MTGGGGVNIGNGGRSDERETFRGTSDSPSVVMDAVRNANIVNNRDGSGLNPNRERGFGASGSTFPRIETQ